MSGTFNITLNQLRAFESIARLGSFRAAADELRLTQPSISQRIRELESALGVALFERRGPRIAPTPQAHELLTYAERMLSTSAELRARFRSREALRGMLRIGVSENVALVCLAEILQRLEQRHPALLASVFVGDSAQLSTRMDERALDIAIIAEPSVGRHVTQIPVGLSRPAWFAASRLPLPRGRLSASQLAEHHLMVSPPPARAHTTVTRWLQATGVSPPRLSTCNNVAVTRLAILSGAVIGLVPARIMREDVQERRVRRIEVDPLLPGHHMALCHPAGSTHPGLLACVELMRELLIEFEVFEPEAPVPPARRPSRPIAKAFPPRRRP